MKRTFSAEASLENITPAVTNALSSATLLVDDLHLINEINELGVVSRIR
jgi:hypothetical protein